MANFDAQRFFPIILVTVAVIGVALLLSGMVDRGETNSAKGAESSGEDGASRTAIVTARDGQVRPKRPGGFQRGNGTAAKRSTDDKPSESTGPIATATPEAGDPYLGESLIGVEPGYDAAAVFAEAGAEFGVPEDLLKAVAFVESQMDHKGGALNARGGRGLMGLREDGAVETLDEAAKLLGTDKRTLVIDPTQNVRGAAALLKDYYDKPQVAIDSNSAWQVALARYSGLRAEEAVTYGQHVLNIMREGMQTTAPDGTTVTIATTELP